MVGKLENENGLRLSQLAHLFVTHRTSDVLQLESFDDVGVVERLQNRKLVPQLITPLFVGRGQHLEGDSLLSPPVR